MGSKHALSTVSQRDQSKKPRLQQSLHPQHSTYGKPVPFNLRREVFLSHSGRDKEFVRHLHKALRSSYQGIKVAFFDEETIPKAEAVSMENILEEARTSKLGVLVLTDDFFTHTRNPMLELEALVGAEVKLLPLFLTMSVEQFKEKERRDRWLNKWREWSAVDDKLVNLESWGHALSLVSTFSGLEFCKLATNQSGYIDKVVKQVTRIIGPAIPLTKGGVIHGKDRLCQMVDASYKKAAAKHFSSAQNASNTQAASTSASNSCGLEEECCNIITSTVVGIHGFTGLGKTTLCKWLCDFYHQELSGRVCYIDVGSLSASRDENSASYNGRLQHVISTLSPHNHASDSHPFQHLSNDQLENLLRAEFSSMKGSVFLAIDNVLSERQSQEEADLYLSCEFPKGSRIFITSRSEGILANLIGQHEGSFSVTIDYMPPLEFKEAREVFVSEFPMLRKLGITDQQELDDVTECVKLCTIYRERYHPLMLKSLAAFIRWARSTPKVDWKERMAELRSKGIHHDMKGDVWRKVFSVFEMAYELLSGEARKVFLDLALSYSTRSFFGYQLPEWISMLHSHLGEKTVAKIILQLQDTCYVERNWMGTIEVPHIMVDFGKYKAQHENTYVVVDDSTVWPDHDRLPSSARHISISRVLCKASETELDLRDVEGVEVLHLVDNAGLQQVLLSPTTCDHLRSLIVIAPKSTMLRCTLDEDWPSSSPQRRRGGPFLKWMKFQGDVSFQCTGVFQVSERGKLRGNHDMNFHSLTKLEISSEAADPVSILAFPRNVEVLHLRALPNVQSIDLTACANLKDVRLWDMPSLIKFLAPEGNSHHLQYVYIGGCTRLLALTVSTNSRANYLIEDCPSLQTLSCWAGSRSECERMSSRGNLIIFTDIIRGLHNLLAEVRLEDLFGRFPIKAADVDCSICKSKVVQLRTSEYSQAGLAGLEDIMLLDAQHIGLFISALCEAQPDHLVRLRITCKKGGVCGCDQNAPHFGLLPWHEGELPTGMNWLSYSCPQVRDLASLVQWNVLERLDLEGCTRVEVWPDFTAMTGLRELILRNTSLEKWPTAVLLLPRLRLLDLSGCRNLPTKELVMNSVVAVPESMTIGQLTCIGCTLTSLAQDLREGIKDWDSVADALDTFSPELVNLFNRASSSNSVDGYRLLIVQKLVVEIMYGVWFGSAFDDTCRYYTTINKVRGRRYVEEDDQFSYVSWGKMRGLLCSESFMSLPFRACKDLISLNFGGWISKDEMFPKFLSPRYPVITHWNDIRDESDDRREWLLAGMAAMGLALLGEGALAFSRWISYDWISLFSMSTRRCWDDMIFYKLHCPYEQIVGLEDWILAGCAATGIGLVLTRNEAMSFNCCSASLDSVDRNCVLNVLKSPFRDKLFNRIGHLKQVRWKYKFENEKQRRFEDSLSGQVFFSDGKCQYLVYF